MTHDFAKKPKPERRKTDRRKTAAKKKKSAGVPGWVWLLTGIVAGVFISFLGFLADITPEPAPTASAKQESSKTKTKEPEESGTRFDFYTLLPEREVIVPTEREEGSQQPEQAFQYILQAGSFKHAEDADRLRAKLLILGLDVRVDPVKGRGGDTWHRVQVGPFTSRSKLSKARSTLIHEGIETLLLKRKLEG
jgi:cell division protein FtsN